MDTLTFISKLVESVIWPFATVAIVLLLRGKIGNALANYQALKLRYKDFEVNLDKKLESVESEVTKVAQEKNISFEVIDSPKLQQLAKLSPRAAILEAWIELEELLYSLLERMGYSRDRPGGIMGKMTLRPFHEVVDILIKIKIYWMIA